MLKTWAPSLGRRDPLEKGMATHSSILVWKIPWTGEPGGLQSMKSQELGTTLPAGPSPALCRSLARSEPGPLHVCALSLRD